MALSGNGLEPDLQLSATELNFENTVINSTSASETLTISNLNGAGDLIINALSIEGENAEQFNFDGDF